MFKYIRMALFLSVLAAASTALAQIEFQKDTGNFKQKVLVTGFIDYPPFGEVGTSKKPETFESIFESFMNNLAKEKNYELVYVTEDSYDNLVRRVRRGEVDLILGMYSETDKYTGLDYIYPAISNNPMSIITLPEKAEAIKRTSDLSGLKGAMNSNEVLSDYVTKETAKLNLQKVDNSHDLFRLLFLGKIDYILSGYYFGIVEASRLGLRGQVVFSRRPVWDMPIFFGVSKVSKKRASLAPVLKRASESQIVKDKIQKDLTDKVEEIERNNSGIVPPAYSSEK